MSDQQIHHEPGGNWLRRFLARLGRKPSGDIIAVNIGEGARNVAVGRYVWQTNVRIGALVVPVRFILVLLAAAAAVAAGVWYAVVPARMSPDTFNVAVAEFGQVDQTGQVHGSPDGSTLSRWMFGKLQSESAALPPGVKLELWHDSQGLLHKRSTIGVIATEAQAARKAREINAHMVVYGVLDANQDPASFSPRFYVADLRAEVSEIGGGQKLGAPIALRPPLDLTDLKTGVYLEQNLQPRAEALAWFTRGLAFDLAGQNDQALAVFREAEQRFKTWPSDQGQEILYVFMAREAVFLERSQVEASKAFDSTDAALDFAQRALDQALAINPAYDRAHLWLGNVYSVRARQILATRNLGADELARVRDHLDRAAEQYRQALANAESPASLVAVRTQLSLGSVGYFRAASYLLSGDSAAAEPLYQSAIDQVLKTLPLVGKDQYRIRAQAYQVLGAAAFAQGHANWGNDARSLELWKQSIAYYDQCLAQAKLDPYDAFLQSVARQQCQPEREEVVKAQAQLAPAG